MIIQPLQGRHWLPPDCETTEQLLATLWTHYDAETKAIHRGNAHVQKYRALRDKARDALAFLVKVTSRP